MQKSDRVMAGHPAHEMQFAELADALKAARADRLVYERPGPDGLVLYVYTERCVWESLWTPVTMAARGLILDTNSRRIAATPFPKFFNLGERGETIPDLPFDTTEKLDGSLIIIFHHKGRWRAATKGAFESAQAVWAQARIDALDLSSLVPGTTYLAEAVYPENRIVVRYEEPALVMLAAYDEGGSELPYEVVEAAGAALGWRTAHRHHFDSVSDLLAHAKTLPRSEEGFVLRFEDGSRLKVKGDEYRRIHALICRVTPLAMWEAMVAGDDLETIRRDLPEEFWTDFDDITGLLRSSQSRLIERVAAVAESIRDLSDKELGLRLESFDPEVRAFLFPYRRGAGNLLQGRTRQLLFKALRPTGNVLPGYTPSYGMNRVIEESA